MLIPGIFFERELLQTVKDLLKFQAELGVEPPIFALLTLIGVRGYSMAVGAGFLPRTPTPIERDHLFVPEVVVESFESTVDLIVKELVDPVWNACGFSETPNFKVDKQEFRWRT